MIKLILTVPPKDNAISELRKTLTEEKADIYIFPEGFLLTEQLEEALEIIKEFGSFVITGLKDVRGGIRYETALVIDSGTIVGEYQKCILTKSERAKGKVPGESIHCIDTKFGKIGIPICYEIHFPEVARIMALEEPVLLVNMIGTGMYHELQYGQWTVLARARAIENEVFVVGCCHDCGEIPLAFAYSPQGEILLQEKKSHGRISLEVDLEESGEKKINYMADRRPEVFGKLSEDEVSEIVPACCEEIDAILQIYDIAKQYMVASGNPNQWNSTYPERQLLLKDIEMGQLYVYKENGVIHGVFAYIQGDDPTYAYIEDGAWLNDKPYGTIHRLASDGSIKGIFKECVDFCLAKCENLRADTHRDNHTMQHLLEKYNFQRCGIIYLSNGADRMAYQYFKE